MNSRASRWLILISATLFVCQSATAGVMNGDFSDTSGSPFAHWTTLYGNAPVDGGGIAMFDVIDFFDESQLEQTFTLLTPANALSFEFNLSSVPGGSLDVFGLDVFQVTLFDAFGDVLFPISSGVFGDPRFYGFDSSGNEFKSSQATVENFAIGAEVWKRVSLDISSLVSQQLTLEFLLLGDDDSRSTTVLLDNVVVSQATAAVPEPATIAIWAFLGTATLGLGRKRKPIPVDGRKQSSCIH